MSKRIRTRVFIHRRVAYRHAGGHASFACGTRLRLEIWRPDQTEPRGD